MHFGVVDDFGQSQEWATDGFLTVLGSSLSLGPSILLHPTYWPCTYSNPKKDKTLLYHQFGGFLK